MDLQERIHTDTTHMALIFTARSVGYLLGSLVGGFLFDHFDKQLLLMVTLIVAAMATSIIPWSLTLAVLTVLMSLQGMSMGVLDTGKTVFFIMRATVLLLIYQWKLGKYSWILLNDLILDVISEYTDYDLPANILSINL